MSDFFINTIRVDMARGKVFREGETLSLEPRVLQVLLQLIEHRGEVVSHQALLDAVWGNTIVEPSALQRCIAQLRKSFGDDARRQEFIATYPKKGYSLVADISRQPPVLARENHPADAMGAMGDIAAIRRGSSPSPLNRLSALLGRATPRLSASAMIGATLVGGLLLAFAWSATPKRVAQQFLDQAAEPSTADVMPATPDMPYKARFNIPAADDFPVYSPDGRYVVYPRYLMDKQANLWARDLAYGNDFLITEEAGSYEYLTWSADGSQLLFVDSTCQSQACGMEQCTSLKSVTLSQSETNTLRVEKIIPCSPGQLLAPTWLEPGQLAFIELAADAATLVQYGIASHEKRSLFSSKDLLPYHLSYSRQTNTLTIMASKPHGEKTGNVENTEKVLLFLDLASGRLNTNNSGALSNDDFYPSSTPISGLLTHQ